MDIEIFSFLFAVTSGQAYYYLFIVFNRIHSVRIICNYLRLNCNTMTHMYL